MTQHIKTKLLPGAVVWATDVNELAIAKTLSLSGSSIEAVCADLFSCFKPPRRL